MVTTWIWRLGIPGSRQFWLITEVVAVLGHDLGYWNILEHHFVTKCGTFEWI